MLSTFGPGDTLNARAIPGAVDVVGPVDASTAIDAGMGYYEYNARRGVRTGKGRSTLVDSAGCNDAPRSSYLASGPGTASVLSKDSLVTRLEVEETWALFRIFSGRD